MIRRAEDVFSGEIEGETVLMSVESGKFFSMNTTGTAIWSLLESPSTRSQMKADLISRYAVDEETCLRELDQFLEELLQRELVLLS